MIKSLDDLLREYNSQSESNKETEGKALDCLVQDGGGCTCCPGSGDDQFECCQLGGCLACVAI
jgi:hypothetical protein